MIFSGALMVLIYALSEDELKYIAFGSIMYSALFALVWVVPISFGVLFLGTKIHSLPDTWSYKKHVIRMFRWMPGLTKKILLGAIYLILSAIWIFLTFGCLIALGLQEGG